MDQLLQPKQLQQEHQQRQWQALQQEHLQLTGEQYEPSNTPQ